MLVVSSEGDGVGNVQAYVAAGFGSGKGSGGVGLDEGRVLRISRPRRLRAHLKEDKGGLGKIGSEVVSSWRRRKTPKFLRRRGKMEG